MRHDQDEREIHDYLDGRLREPERTAFENRLREDAALAEKIRAYREVGATLREQVDDVPPGFYARARSRFQAQRGRRRFKQLLSWETAGLVGAAVLAAALFLPFGVKDQREPPAALEPVTAQAPPSPKDQASRPEGPATLPDATPETPPLAANQDRRESAPKARRVDPSPIETVPVPQSLEVPLDAGPAPAPALAGVREDRNQETLASAAPQRVSLPAGFLENGRVRIVDDLSEWEALLRDSSAATALETLAPPAPGRRLVLLGARAPALDCSALTVTAAGQTWEIRAGSLTRVRSFSESSSAAQGGCALVLPQDARPVVWVDEAPARPGANE